MTTLKEYMTTLQEYHLELGDRLTYFADVTTAATEIQNVFYIQKIHLRAVSIKDMFLDGSITSNAAEMALVEMEEDLKESLFLLL